jgi:tetratricopeptide (TPR) repeat protein
MIFIDSFTWQFFFALTWTTPFEKPKKETILFLSRKQIFNFIYHYLIKGEPLDDGSVYKVSGASIRSYLLDSYNKIFNDIENDFEKNGKVFISEFKNHWNIKGKEYQNIYKPKSIEKIIDELMNDSGIFYKELKDSYEGNIDDLKNKWPKLYNLLRINKENKHFIRAFREAIEESIKSEIKDDTDDLKLVIEEIPNSKIKYPYYYDYMQSHEIHFNFDDDIQHWREGEVYNPQWRILELVLDFLAKNNKTTFVHRLIGLYLKKNAQRAIENILHISESEQEKIIKDIKRMINNKNEQPEIFYTENDSEFLEQIDLIYICLTYQHNENFDIETSNKIIKIIEDKCPNSKKFFSSWLNARSMVFEKGELILNDQETLKQIINKYRNAYDEGIAYAGCYLRQFLLEAIVINSYSRNIKNKNDFYGYGYALELFEQDKQNLLNFIKATKNKEPDKDFIDIHYSCNLRAKSIIQLYPNFQYRHEFYNEAMNINNKGLEFEKASDHISAIDSFSKAIMLYPDYANAYSNRGNVYSKMNEDFTEKALADFNMAILFDPKHENTLFKRGKLLLKKYQFDKAIIDFTEVIKINSWAIDAYLERGNCYIFRKDFNRAIDEYNKAIEINPSYLEAYKNRRAVYYLLGDIDKANDDLCKAMQIDPNFSP